MEREALFPFALQLDEYEVVNLREGLMFLRAVEASAPRVGLMRFGR